jgi:hypothetical protein
VPHARFLGDWLAPCGEARFRPTGAQVNASRPARLAALAVLGALALTLGIAVGGGRAADDPGGQMPICDPGECYSTSTEATTATTTPTATDPTPGGGDGGPCSDGRDNDGNGLADYPDDFQGCTSASDPGESADDYPSSAFDVDQTYEFGLQSDGTYTDSSGVTTSCAYAGGRRYAKDRILHKTVWSFTVISHWCWNGATVTQATGPQVTIDRWGFPYNIAFPVSYRLLDQQNAAAGGSSAQANAQGEFQMCGRSTPVCQVWHPWIGIVMYGNGQVSCHSDQGTLTGCKGNGP